MNEVHGIAPTPLPQWSQTLRDASRVRIRPIASTDRASERAFIEGLSDESRRHRFLGQISAPSERMLDCLVNIDPLHDAALVAVTCEDDAERIVGAARFSSDSDAVNCECAVVVADQWQGRGLGTALMRHLIDIARARGIDRMYSVDMAENADMRELAMHLGFRVRAEPGEASLVVYELSL